MEGPKNAPPEDLGIYYRSVSTLFKIVEERRELLKISVSVNLLEVYNEEIHDPFEFDVEMGEFAKAIDKITVNQLRITRSVVGGEARASGSIHHPTALGPVPP